MPKVEKVLFADNFKPDQDTGVLNAILEDLYNRVNGSQPNNPPSVRVFSTVNLSINNNAFTSVSFNTERWDTDDFWTSSLPTRLTIKFSGRYFFSASAQFAGAGTGRRGVRVLLNGSVIIARTLIPSGSINQPQVQVADFYNFAANDYIEMQVYQDSGGAINVESAGNYSPEFALQQLSEF